MKPVNLKTLAQALNLSVATISRALSDRPDISRATKDRVRALAAELDYIPNPHASSLRRTIGVVLPEVANHFLSLAINGIQEVARQNDYHVLIYLTHDDNQREEAIVRLLASGRVDGVLASVASTSWQFEHFDLLLERGVPLVFFDRVPENAATATQRRLAGYRTALEEAGLPFEAGLVLHTAEGESAAAIQALLARRPEIDGVFAAVEGLAMDSYRA